VSVVCRERNWLKDKQVLSDKKKQIIEIQVRLEPG
jgi:hypothetical protein